MTKFDVKIFAFAVFGIIGFSINSSAQMYNPNQYSNPVIQKMHYNQMMTTKAIGGLIQIHMLKAGNKSGRQNSARTVRAKRDPLMFQPANVTVISDAEMAQMTKNEQEKKVLSQLFNSAVQSYAQVAIKDGFPYNDLGYAFNFFVVNNYHVYKDIFKKYKGFSNRGIVDVSTIPNFIDLTGERTIYNQFRTILAANPQIAKLTDAEKERFTAQMAIMTNVPWMMYDRGITDGNDEMIKNAQMMAKQNLENLFGTSAENILIDASGITVKDN